MFCVLKWVNGIFIFVYIYYMSIIFINFMMGFDNYLVNDLLIFNFGFRGY